MGEKTYLLHVTLPDFDAVWRKIELRADQTLEDLHLAIQEAFEFDDDHLYSFFMSGKPWDKSTEYTLLLEDDFGPAAPFDLSALLNSTGLGASTGDADDKPGPVRDNDGNPASTTDPHPGQAGLFDPSTLLNDPGSLADFIRSTGTPPTPPTPPGSQETVGYDQPPEAMDIPPEMGAGFGNLFQQLQRRAQDELDKMSDEEKEDTLQQAMDVLGNMGFGKPRDDYANVGDVTVTTLDALELKPRQKFLYLFDYGDEWRFNVKVEAIGETDDDDAADYPRLVAAQGEAPEQYWFEDDEEEYDIDDDDDFDDDEDYDPAEYNDED